MILFSTKGGLWKKWFFSFFISIGIEEIKKAPKGFQNNKLTILMFMIVIMFIGMKLFIVTET